MVYFLFTWHVHHGSSVPVLSIFFILEPRLAEQSEVPRATSPHFMGNKSYGHSWVQQRGEACTPPEGGRGGMSRHMVKLVPAGSCIIHLLGGTADILNNITTYHSLGLGVNFGTEWLCDLGKVACSLWASIPSFVKFGGLDWVLFSLDFQYRRNKKEIWK